MALFDSIIEDLAGKSGLGANAAPMVREILTLFTGAPGGFGGFLNQIKSAGLGSELLSWIGNPQAAPLLGSQVEKLIGAPVVSGIAHRVGLSDAAASAATAFALPKLIGVLTPGGTIPASLPAEVVGFIDPGEGRVVAIHPEKESHVVAVHPETEGHVVATHAEGEDHVVAVHPEPRKGLGWFWAMAGVLGLALVAALLTYLFSGENRAPVETAQAPAVVQAPVVAPAPAKPAAPLPPATFSLSNENGTIHISGSVADEATRASILDELKAVYGADNIKGDITVDADRAPAPWLGKIHAALETLKIPGLSAFFHGNAIEIGGIADAERSRLSGLLASLFGSDWKFGALAGPAPAPAAVMTPSQPATFSLSNRNGTLHFSGSVHDEATRASILDELKAVYGADKIKGDITVDPNRAAAPWLSKIHAALDSLKIPGLEALFSGNSIDLGGLADDAERSRLYKFLAGLFGGDWKIGGLSEHFGEIVTSANSNAVSSLAALKPDSSAADLVGVLNLSIINFATASAEIPDQNMAMLKSAAAQMKHLPPGTMIEVAGYTDDTGSDETNIPLSQRRADAVRNELVSAGADPAMLVAKGYGSANPVASNDTAEGRFRNRRIEYRLTK